MQATNTRPRFEVTADAHGICSHAGVVLLAELADRLGLTSELGRRANLGLARPGGGHAHVEDRIRTAKATGLANLPFADFGANDVWLTLVLVAQALVAWAQALLLDGELAHAEPKTLRYRLWHTAARLVHHARRVIVRFDHD